MTPTQKKLAALMPYILLMFLAVYITGLAPRFFGEKAYYFSNFMLMYGLLIVIGVTSFVHSFKYGFTWYFPLIFPLIFTSTIYTLYGGSTEYYLNVLVYLVFSFVFELVGAAMYRKKQNYAAYAEAAGAKRSEKGKNRRAH